MRPWLVGLLKMFVSQVVTSGIRNRDSKQDHLLLPTALSGRQMISVDTFIETLSKNNYPGTVPAEILWCRHCGITDTYVYFMFELTFKTL